MGGGTGREAVGIAVGWSCCNADEGAPGCALGEHNPVASVSGELSDLRTGATLRRRAGSHVISSTPNGSSMTVDTSRSNASHTSGAARSSDRDTYVVGVGDSIASISMKVKVPRDKLIKWNKLFSSQVSPGQVLRTTAPPKPTAAERMAEARLKFQRRTGCSEAEAQKYMDSADVDLDRAVSEFEADNAMLAEVGGNDTWVMLRRIS
ncbi:hypothetical protein AB1Y20_000535 [Prymnesium parvum]|uniref:LysM domain-containing protein n=1 Tax=Prymnesium parvum TaxID=97485 RepID=A0AB34K8U1_PRYPA